MYEIFWEYEVRPEQKVAFEQLYGTDGEWARLFCGADGYIETHLFRDSDRPTRYLTVDRWIEVRGSKVFRFLGYWELGRGPRPLAPKS